MNRRAFLASVAGAIAAPPVAKVAPPVSGIAICSNGELMDLDGGFHRMIMAETLKQLHNNLVFARLMERQCNLTAEVILHAPAPPAVRVTS